MSHGRDICKTDAESGRLAFKLAFHSVDGKFTIRLHSLALTHSPLTAAAVPRLTKIAKIAKICQNLSLELENNSDKPSNNYIKFFC